MQYSFYLLKRVFSCDFGNTSKNNAWRKNWRHFLRSLKACQLLPVRWNCCVIKDILRIAAWRFVLVPPFGTWDLSYFVPWTFDAILIVVGFAMSGIRHLTHMCVAIYLKAWVEKCLGKLLKCSLIVISAVQRARVKRGFPAPRALGCSPLLYRHASFFPSTSWRGELDVWPRSNQRLHRPTVKKGSRGEVMEKLHQKCISLTLADAPGG